MFVTKLSFIDREKIAKDYQDGTSGQVLAERYGVDVDAIYRALRKQNVSIRTKKFDCELADKLRTEYEAGATTTELAKKYETTKQRVARYIREAGGTLRKPGTRPNS